MVITRQLMPGKLTPAEGTMSRGAEQTVEAPANPQRQPVRARRVFRAEAVQMAAGNAVRAKRDKAAMKAATPGLAILAAVRRAPVPAMPTTPAATDQVRADLAQVAKRLKTETAAARATTVKVDLAQKGEAVVAKVAMEDKGVTGAAAAIRAPTAAVDLTEGRAVKVMVVTAAMAVEAARAAGVALEAVTGDDLMSS